jgi:tRNA(adenine34) deaminase
MSRVAKGAVEDNTESIDEQFMAIAIQQARLAWLEGEVPVGAVLVKDGKVIATGYNRPIGNSDPSAHAEMVALRVGAELLNNYRLPGCELYVTLEPCLMCSGAMMHARLSRVIFGASDAKTGTCGSVMNVFDHTQLNHHTQVTSGVLAEQCSNMLKAFFAERRQLAQQKKLEIKQNSTPQLSIE